MQKSLSVDQRINDKKSQEDEYDEEEAESVKSLKQSNPNELNNKIALSSRSVIARKP